MRRISALLATLLLAACSGSSASVQPRTPEASPTPLATPGPTASPSPTPTATPIPTPTELVLDQLGYVRLEYGAASEQDWELGNVPSTLVIGTLDGQVAVRIDAGQWEEWDWQRSGTGPVRRWASAPAAGRVLWAGGTQLHAVDLSNGADHVVYEAPTPIDHGVASPDGGAAFVAQREAGSANWSVWRIDLQGAAEPKLLRSALPESVAASGIVLARSGATFVRVVVAPDGATLAVEECGGPCRIWTLDLSTGAERQYPAADPAAADAWVWPLRGVIGNVVLDDFALNLESRERSDAECIPALQIDGSAVLVCHGGDDAPLAPGAEVIDPRTGASRQAPLEEDQEVMLSSIADLDDAYPRVELPAGWVLAEDRHFDPDQACNVSGLYAWNIDTGELVLLSGVFPVC